MNDSPSEMSPSGLPSSNFDDSLVYAVLEIETFPELTEGRGPFPFIGDRAFFLQGGLSRTWPFVSLKA